MSRSYSYYYSMDIYSRILMWYGWNAPPVSPRRHVRQQVVSINIDTRVDDYGNLGERRRE